MLNGLPPYTCAVPEVVGSEPSVVYLIWLTPEPVPSSAVSGVKAALPNGEPLTVSAAAATVTTPLVRLSAPCQPPRTGVTVYFQVPPGTSSSTQLVAVTEPVQLPTVLSAADPPPDG